jgi:Fe2+ or Zn2+ uptake regulation protein
MPLDADTIARQLTARGLRLTRQRRAVLDAAMGADSGVSPVQVFDAARRACPELGLTTVYRTLDLLREIGALRRVHGSERCETFAPAGAAHGHTVACSRCGRVTEFTECDMRAVAAAAARQTGYHITEHFLQLGGLCGECAGGKASGEGAPADEGGA